MLNLWVAEINYALMTWVSNKVDTYWWTVIPLLTAASITLGMSPLKTAFDHTFPQILAVYTRRLILTLYFILFGSLPLILLLIIVHNFLTLESSSSLAAYQTWLSTLFSNERYKWHFPMALCVLVPLFFRLIASRYLSPIKSNLHRFLRKRVSEENLSDIRTESARKAKDFNPADYYPKAETSDPSVFVGLDEAETPINIPLSTWHETNMQIIGPTRYGKGIILGNLLNQSIKRGDCVVYVDPKRDKFAPHIMYQACKEAGRKFMYLTLHDDGIGKWSPFEGGSFRDALARLERAFGLEFTGDPGTDYYKSKERTELVKTFKKTRGLEPLLNFLEEKEDSRITAELSRWKEIETLRPKKGKGFSIEKALKENAVIYVQGHLDDDVVKTATKVFIVELIQEARRLDAERTSHLSAFIDEVSFLVSKELAQAMATSVGFRVNFILAYQSQNDLLNLEDKTVNAKYVYNSINVNCQIKAVYGGADKETAQWASDLSGTISKNVTKLERTEVSQFGGESWERARATGPAEENLITTNTIIGMPPRVCVFIQPGSLSKVCYTSFVKVNNMSLLEDYLSHKTKVYSHNNKPNDEKSEEKTKLEGKTKERKENAKPKTPKIDPFQDQQAPDKTPLVSPFNQSKDPDKTTTILAADELSVFDQ